MLNALLAPALIAASLTSAPLQVGDMFPSAQEPLEITVGEDGEGMSFYSLVQAYAGVTGQNLTWSEDTESLMRQINVAMTRSVTVPAEEVQGTFESLMIGNQFVLQPMVSGDTSIIRVESLNGTGRSNARSKAIYIDADRTDIARQHPAVIFATAIHVPNLDVRQVSNSLRSMITDANTQQLLPAGTTSSIVVVGCGEQLAGIADILRTIDDAAARNAKARVSRVEVIALKNGDAQSLAQICGTAFSVPGQVQPGAIPGRTVHIAPDERTNSLVVCGTAAEQQRVAELVAKLDVEMK